jgi:hypothetical protein
MKKYLLLIIWLFFFGIWISDYLDTIFNSYTRNYVKSVSTKNILQKSMAFTTTGNVTGWVVACINCNGLNMFKNIYLTNLSQDWLYPELTVDSTGQVYKDQLAGASAHLTGTKTLTMTGLNTNYAIPWPFENDISIWFKGSGDSIVYTGTTKTFLIQYTTSVWSDTNANTVTLDILINGTGWAHFVSVWILTNTVSVASFSAMGTQVLNSGDTIQLVAKSNKAGSILTFYSYSTIAQKFY